MPAPFAQAPAPFQAPAPAPTWPPAAPAPRPAPRAAAPAPVAQVAPKPIIRMQAPEDSRSALPRPAPAAPATFTLPSPTQLGLSNPDATGPDWSFTRTRLRDLGAIGFQLDPLPAGGWLFTCWMPTARPGVSERIEARASCEAEAVRLVLEQAGRWKTQHP